MLGRLLSCLALVCGMRSVRARISEALGTTYVSDRALVQLAQRFAADAGAANAEDQDAGERPRKRTRRNKNTHREQLARKHTRQTAHTQQQNA